MKNPVAFDYDTQTWKSGAPALALRRQHLQQDLALLTGPQGPAYAKFVGIPDITSHVASLQDELATIEKGGAA